jgi:T4 RnlA family RNA ligase
MNLFSYLQIDADKLDEYIDSRLIDRNFHDKFPLAIMCYGRKAVYDNIWDSVTTKCRGLIYNTETFEIVARPFEKFFNYGDTNSAKMEFPISAWPEPEIYEKMDGFLCILYNYNGIDYIASKSSFNSVHAKWATKWYQKHFTDCVSFWPKGFTPVFEGITPNLRIVVDYGKREGLTLLALVNNETGEEVPFTVLKEYAHINVLEIADTHECSMAVALADANTDKHNFEGYVLVWQRPGQTPFRLKVKYLEYLRLHRMVTQVSPKRILEALSNGWDSVLQEYVENSTPWFKKYVTKWKTYLENEYAAIATQATTTFIALQEIAKEDVRLYNRLWTRKDWAERITAELNKPISNVLFAMLDGKDVRPIIWKMLKSKVSGVKPLVDSHV